MLTKKNDFRNKIQNVSGTFPPVRYQSYLEFVYKLESFFDAEIGLLTAIEYFT